jgi:hypothetical protein
MKTLPGLTFEPETHTYKYQGRKVPSVTQILEPYSGMEFVDQDLKEITGEFGNHVHQACHLFNLGMLDRESLTESVEAYLQGWENFLNDSGQAVVYTEVQVYSPSMGYAGTLDQICTDGNGNDLYDIKTGSSVPKTVGPQTEAYRQAWQEMTGQRLKKRYCVHLDPRFKRKYNLVPLNDPRDWERFKAALIIHNWKN